MTVQPDNTSANPEEIIIDLRRQLTATSDVLQVISSSPGEVQLVFETILAKATEICAAQFGVLALREEDGFHFHATLHLPAAFIDYLKANDPLPIVRNGAIERMVNSREVIHLSDLKSQPIAKSASAQRRALVELAGAQTMLWVPMVKQDQVVGMIAIYRTEVRTFSEQQIDLVKSFASQAVIAIENARLLSELRERNEEIARWNRDLEARVADQVEELGRVRRLKRFLAPQLAEMIVSQGDEKLLESHRREIVVVFCDLRGYTAFTETAEPEEVLDFLREYHGALGPLVSKFEGTLDQFSGDGIMVFFNDPVPVPDPAERAVKMAVAMREAASKLIAALRERGRDLGFGVGIAQGYATLGQIGFSERSGYTAIGTVCNVAARLCGEAKDGQILLSQRVNVALKRSVETEQVGALTLKGLTQPVVAHNVPLTASQPALRVVDGGNQP